MPDTPAPAATAKAKGGFWTHKLGPFPVWVWGLGVGAVGIYYWYTHYGPGASKSTGTQPQQQKQQPIRVTETIRNIGRPRPRRGKRPGKAAATPGLTAAANQPVGTGPNPGGPDKKPPRKDRDKRKDRDRGAAQPATQNVTITQTGQPVSPDTGQPVYWEWTHAHRPPEVAYQVAPPPPQPAYAPGTTGATSATQTASDASSAGTAAEVAGALTG